MPDRYMSLYRHFARTLRALQVETDALTSELGIDPIDLARSAALYRLRLESSSHN